jgi:hypothetical protein
MACIDIGIIGCGNISHSYLNGAALSEPSPTCKGRRHREIDLVQAVDQQRNLIGNHLHWHDANLARPTAQLSTCL